VVQLLLDKHPNVNAKGGHFGNALNAATFSGNESVIKLLLEHGADIKTKDNAQHWAAASGHKTIVRLLLARGVEIETRESYNDTALHRGAANGQEAMVELLIDLGASINSTSNHYYLHQCYTGPLRVNMKVQSDYSLTEAPKLRVARPESLLRCTEPRKTGM